MSGDKFDGILHNFLERRAGVDETVADLTTMWERLTNDIGRNAQTNVYRRSLGLPPLSPDIPVQHLHRALWLALALLVALVCLVARNLALTRDLQVLEQENKDAAEEVEREREVRSDGVRADGEGAPRAAGPAQGGEAPEQAGIGAAAAPAQARGQPLGAKAGSRTFQGWAERAIPGHPAAGEALPRGLPAIRDAPSVGAVRGKAEEFVRCPSEFQGFLGVPGGLRGEPRPRSSRPLPQHPLGEWPTQGRRLEQPQRDVLEPRRRLCYGHGTAAVRAVEPITGSGAAP